VTATRSSPDELRRGLGPGDRFAQLRSVSPPAALAVGLTALFLALTCWWLSRNRAMPYGDSGYHLLAALEFHDAIARGHWIEPFTLHDVGNVYPPLTPYVGALGMFVGGRTVAAPILTQNLIYVPLLALACYRIGRRAYGALAGCLAVAFALGAPLIAEQFHVFMLDAPLAALVAATVWLVLESERFARVPIAAAAGVVAGLGLMSKQTFPLYVGGFVLIVLARGGGWRNVRGLGVFVAAALLIPAPWYIGHMAQLHQVLLDAGNELNVPPLARPATLSFANLSWYFWALANGLLLTPLLAFVAIGVATTATVAVRDRERRGATVELLGGLTLAFAAITAMPHKDVRYAMPLLVFLAVLGTGWIARLRRTPRTLAIGVLALAIGASTMGATFGVGPTYSGPLPGNWYAPRGQGVMPLDQLTFYTDHDYMVSGPRRAEDVLGLLRELRRSGIREVYWIRSQAPPSDQDFNFNGLQLFLSMARLTPAHQAGAQTETDSSRLATLIHASRYGKAPPCARLADGGGLWIRLGDPAAPNARDYCPRFHPRVYGP
jgi:4-amino-4-deoxy-L-arabinose transferase-like glycosyltransferase